MSEAITIMGVKIDASAAQKGKDAAVQAAAATSAAYKTADASVTQSSQHMAAAMRKASGDMQQDATKTTNALAEMSKSSAFDRLRTGITAALGPLLAGLAAIPAAIALVTAGFGLMSAAVTQAARFETFQTQLAVLLGSFEKAKTRLDELKDFAAKTPFELPEVVKANITLERMTSGALGTTEALRKVGDTSAMVQQPIEEMAMWVGRLYNGLKANAPVGEATMRLAEVGFISMETKTAIEQLQKTAGKTGNVFGEAWAMVETDMAKSRNAMVLMSTTWSGIMSNISDAWGQLLGTLGEPIMLALKPAMQDLAALLDSMKPRAAQFGEAIAAALQQVYAAFRVLGSDGGIGLSLTAAMDTATQSFTRGIEAAGIILDAVFQRAIYDALKALEAIQQPAFWDGMASALYNAGADFVNVIIDGMNAAMSSAAKMASILSPLLGTAAQLTTGGGLERMVLRQPGAQAALNNGPRPTVPSIADAWSQTSATQTAAQAEWQKRQAAELARIQAAGTASQDNSLLPQKAATPSTATANSDNIPTGRSTNMLSQLQSQAKSVIQGIQTPMEKLEATMQDLAVLRDNGLLSIDQFARASQKARDDYTKAVTDMALKAATPLQRLMMQWKDLGRAQAEMSANIASSVSDNFTRAMMDMVQGTKSAREAFDEMAAAILADITQMIIKMVAQYAIQSALGMVGVSAPTPAPAAAAIYHTGGTVGDSPPGTRFVNLGDYAHASRYATGGKIPGVGSGERAAIMEPGETVLTKDQAEDIRRRLGDEAATPAKRDQGQNFTIMNVLDMKEVERHLLANPQILINMMSRERTRVKAALR